MVIILPLQQSVAYFLMCKHYLIILINILNING